MFSARSIAGSVALYGLCAVVFAAALLIGSVHPHVRAILTLAVSALAVSAILFDYLGKRRLRPGMAFWLSAGLCTLALLQLIPLPTPIRAVLDPVGTKTLTPILTELGIAGARPLAWDVPAAILGLAHYASFGLVILVTSVVARRRDRAVKLAWTLDIGLLTIAGLSLVNYFSGDPRIWWIYQPVADVTNTVAPFVNENHAGGFYLAIALFHFGLSFSLPSSRKRWAILALGLMPTFLCFLAQSRSAHFGLGFGVVVLLLAMYRNHHIDRNALLRTLAIGGVIVVGLIPSVQAVRDAYGVEGLGGIPTDKKIQLWTESGVDIVSDHPWTGVGSGGYEAAASGKIRQDVRGTVTHAENLALQLAAELGLPAAFALLVLSAWFLIGYFRQCRLPPTACGAVGALSGLFFQNLGDFNLSFPGTAFLAAALFGFATAACRRKTSKSRVGRKSTKTKTPKQTPSAPKEGRSRRKRSKQRPRKQTTYIAAASVLAIALATGIFGIFWAAPHSLRNDTARVENALRAASYESAEALVTASSKRHPADYYLHYLRALIQLRRESGEPIKWLNFALTLNRADPRPHFLAGRILADVGAFEQAKSELRRAMRLGLGRTESLRNVMVQVAAASVASSNDQTHTSKLALGLAAQTATLFSAPISVPAANAAADLHYRDIIGELVSAGLPRERDLWLWLADGLLEKGRVQLALALYSSIVQQWPEETEGLLPVARELSRQGRPHDAIQIAQHVARATGAARAYVVAGRIIQKHQGAAEAYEILNEGYGLNPRDVALTAATAKSALRLGKVQQARQIVESRLKAGGVPSQRRAQLLSVMRAIALKEGNMREARLLEHKIARLRILAGREPAETQ